MLKNSSAIHLPITCAFELKDVTCDGIGIVQWEASMGDVVMIYSSVPVSRCYVFASHFKVYYGHYCGPKGKFLPHFKL